MKNGREVNLRGGFLGELDSELEAMKDYMPEGRANMLDTLSEEKPSIRRILRVAQQKAVIPTKDN